MTRKAPLPAVKRPADCWDWITPEDVVRIALASFYGACRFTEHTEDGSPWMNELGHAYGSRAFLAEEMAEQFKLRTYDIAHQKGVGNYLQFVREIQATEAAISRATADTRADIHCHSYNSLGRSALHPCVVPRSAPWR